MITISVVETNNRLKKVVDKATKSFLHYVRSFIRGPSVLVRPREKVSKTSAVNFINVLRARFLPISFRQKVSKQNVSA